MNKLLSTVAFVGAISLAALPASAACGPITKVWIGFNAASWAGGSGNTVWVFCGGDGTAWFATVGALANEQSIANLHAQAITAKLSSCPVTITSYNGQPGGLTAIECD